MFTITTLSGKTRTLMDIANAIEEEGELGTGSFYDHCVIGVAIDCPTDIPSDEPTKDTINTLGWGMNNRLCEVFEKFFSNYPTDLNDSFGLIRQREERAKFMASVFRQLAWYEENGGAI